MARPKGAKNKISGLAKENIAAVFQRLGGTQEMAKWAKANQTDFYRLYARLIPVEHTGPEGGPIVVVSADMPPADAAKAYKDLMSGRS